MGEYVAVIDEDFNYPMPTFESLAEVKRLRSAYTQEEIDAYVALAIAAVSTTDKGLHRVCNYMKQSDAKFPNAVTLLYWIGNNREYAEQYAHGKRTQMDLMAEDIVHIADTEIDPNRARVRIDARKWIASKLAPKKYGERLDVQHSGNLNVLAMTDEELLRIVQEQTGQPMLIECKDVTPAK